MLPALIAVQVVTFVVAGGLFVANGDFRLGIAQLLLAAVQGIIYF